MRHGGNARPSVNIGRATALAVAVLVLHRSETIAGDWNFQDVSTTAGIHYDHELPDTPEYYKMSGGVASGDYNGDGWVDLYVLTGATGPNVLLRNLGTGAFEQVAGPAGVAVTVASSGPSFADIDNDGDLDLLMGRILNQTPVRYDNLGDGTFADLGSTGLPAFEYFNGAAFGDYDRDGDLDVFISQWNRTPAQLLWRNDGAAGFTDDTLDAFGSATTRLLRTFSPAFTDFDADGWPDILTANDFGNSMVLRNLGDGTFEDLTTDVISDEAGMGAAVGDYDNDGDLDWFVSSIGDPTGVTQDPINDGQTGNRLYKNNGNGQFSDVTSEADVREGMWGWGSCFADFDNDTDLDLLHVNGYRKDGAPEYETTATRLYINQGNGQFIEDAKTRNIDDSHQGRGVVCFDYDRDGDVDVFISNYNGPMKLYRNDGGNQHNWLQIKLRSIFGNSEGIGSRIEVTAGGQTQLREIRLGNNYVSNNPTEAHFGLGDFQRINRIEVFWLGGQRSVIGGAAINQYLVIDDTLIASMGFE